MNAEWLGTVCTRIVVPRCALNRIRQAVECGPGLIKRGRHSRRKIAGHSMFEKQLLYRGQTGCICLHHIVPRTSVDVNVNEARSEDAIAKIYDSSARGNLTRAARGA